MANPAAPEKEITWSDSEDSWDEFERAKDRKCTYCSKTDIYIYKNIYVCSLHNEFL